MIGLLRKKATASGTSGSESPGTQRPAMPGASGLSSLEGNAATKKRQTMMLYAALGVLCLAGGWWIMTPSTGDKPAGDPAATDTRDRSKSVHISTDDMVNRNLADKEWMALSENQITQQASAIKSLQGDQGKVDTLQKQVQELQTTNEAIKADGTKVLSAYEGENRRLQSQIADLATQLQHMTSGPTGLYGQGAPGTYQRAAGAPLPGGGAASAGALTGPGVAGTGAMPIAPAARSNEVRLMAFTGEGTGTGTKITPTKATQYTDSENYLPPNSMALAKVVVGVDAPANTRSQTDPLPVVLRITGPARSVYANGHLLKTNIIGCMVNGAAQGDLSSEKVYVKLQRMTCPQPGGRVSVAEVKGFIAFGGKTGVRGHVVSREGNLVGQAFLAGLVGGFGKAFSANSQALLNQPSVTVNGTRPQLSASDLAQGGFGGGVAQSGDMVSKYLIERAEQYQPVVEMPTGLDVEVVFLDGVFIRN